MHVPLHVPLQGLVVCPAVACRWWVDTLRAITTFRVSEDVTAEAQVHVITCSAFINLFHPSAGDMSPARDALSRHTGVVVFDEAHVMRTPAAMSAIRAFYNSDQPKLPIVLTATPYQNSMYDFARVLSIARLSRKLMQTTPENRAVTRSFLSKHMFRNSVAAASIKEVVVGVQPSAVDAASYLVDANTASPTLTSALGWTEGQLAKWNARRHLGFAGEPSEEVTAQMAEDLRSHYNGAEALWSSVRTSQKVATAAALISTVASRFGEKVGELR